MTPHQEAEAEKAIRLAALQIADSVTTPDAPRRDYMAVVSIAQCALQSAAAAARQEARREALEEAARLAQDGPTHCEPKNCHMSIARAIRALATPSQATGER